MHFKIKQLVEKLELLPHPEGGFYKETYRSKGVIKPESLRNDIEGERNYATGIYFLLISDNFSAFHRIKQDEMWHFYDGSPLIVHIIDQNGKYKAVEIGRNIEKGEVPQYVVPADCWFASSVKESNNYSFVGCTVSPGFDFRDFELADREKLIEEYPAHKEIITKLTR